MAWPRYLICVRHGESEGNILTADQRAEYDLGTHQYDLTPKGVKQCVATGQWISQTFHVDCFYSSYYKRTRQSASHMFPGAKIYEDPRLAEAQRGIWHVLSHQQIAEQFPVEVLRKEREGLYHYRPMGGENWPDVELRIHSFLGTLNRDQAGKSVVLIGHGHWFILLDRLIRHFSIEEAVKQYRDGPMQNAAVTVYESDPAIVRVMPNFNRLELKQRHVPWEGLSL